MGTTQIQSGGRIKQLEAELEATNDQMASLKEMINMIMKQNEQLLNGGVQMEDAVGFRTCTLSHVFTLQSQHGSILMTQDMLQFENARCHCYIGTQLMMILKIKVLLKAGFQVQIQRIKSTTCLLED
ncbi:hypothetical protein ACOSQ2_013139 [Xanthoceras sorbifolium]